MCWVSRAIAPRDPWSESGEGEWYFNRLPTVVPWWAIAWLWDESPLETCQDLQLAVDPPKPTQVAKPQERGAQAAPHRAPPRERSISTGTTAPNPPARVQLRRIIENCLETDHRRCAILAGEAKEKTARKEKYIWFDPKPSDPNEMEVLLYALLLCWHAVSCQGVADLQSWAKKVSSYVDEAEMLTVQWTPPEKVWPVNNSISSMYDPMHAAFSNVCNIDDLGTIAAAMRLWDGPGRCDELDGKMLSNYRLKGYRAVSKNRKKPNEGPPRWRSWVIVYVAELIHRHGRALRRALKLDDMEVDEVPTAHERALTAEARVAELELDLEALGAQLKKAEEAKRKAAERGKLAMQRKREAVAKVRAAEAVKVKAKIEVATVKLESKTKRALEAAEERLEERYEEDTSKRAKQVSVARGRARAVEYQAKQSAKRLKRALAAEAKVTELALQLDALMEEVEPEEAEEEPRFSVPVPKGSKRRAANGRFEALPWRHRALIWAQHARRTPPTAIAANITDVLEVFAKEQVVPMPCLRQIQKMRGELTVAGECMAAFRVALARRIVSFGFDESTKFGLGLMSTNTQIEPHDAPGETVDIVQRGATLTVGGTAEEICKAIDEKIFAHSRRLLMGWRGEHESMFGKGSWEKDGGPSPDAIGLHRLSEETLLMSDTCNAARAAKRLLAEAAEKASRLAIGDEAWAAMSESQQERACTCFIGDCHTQRLHGS